MNFGKNWKKYLSVIGIALFIYILIRLDIVKVISVISHAKLSYLVLAALTVFLILVVQTFKWFVIAKKQKIDVPFSKAFKINFITKFYGFVTPSKIGTVTRAGYLKKYTKNIGKGFSNFVLDKILDICSVFFLAIFFSYLFKEKFSFLPLNLFIALFVTFIFASFIFINKKRSRFLLKIFYRKFVPERVKEKARVTFNSFYENMPKKRYIVLFFFLNIANWIIIYLLSYFVALSVGIKLPFIYFLAVLPIGTLISLIPITINGLGTREAALISLFGLFGIEATKVFSMSILVLFINGVLPSLIAIFIIFKNK